MFHFYSLLCEIASVPRKAPNAWISADRLAVLFGVPAEKEETGKYGFVNVLCDIWQAHISSTSSGTLRPTNYFFPRTLTRSLSSRKTIQVIHVNTTLDHKWELKVSSISLERQVYELLKQREYTAV